MKKNFWLCMAVTGLTTACMTSAFAFDMTASSAKGPIIVNGDTVEYSVDNKQVTASGNILVIYGASRITCQKITADTVAKEVVAEGNVRLEDESGVIEGQKIIYNFTTGNGSIIDAGFMANPYFGKARSIEKTSPREFVARNGYLSTCSFDMPHYRIASKRIGVILGEKIQARTNTLYLGTVPIIQIPQFNRSLKDPMMHMRLAQGKSGDWGGYALSSWKFNLTDYLSGRVYLDYRQRLGFAEGFGLNYNTPVIGKGDFKFYYTDESPKDAPVDAPDSFERYLLRYRHRTDIDPRTTLIAELYKITDERRKFEPDRNFLKDYFYREFEEDAQPLTYALFHHNFQNSVLDFLIQKRVNNWYDQVDRLPQVRYTLPSIRIPHTPFYFDSDSSYVTLNKKAETAPVSPDDVAISRLDTLNKLSLPVKLLFLRVSPFVGDRETVYDKGADGKAVPVRSIFYGGVDVSTRLFKTYDLKTDFLKLNINGLRHIIAPTVSYGYNNTPSIESDKLHQVDPLDTIAQSSAATVELSNKLQTKRDGKSVDLVDFRVTTSYIFDSESPDVESNQFSDVYFYLTLMPYSWLRFDADALYDHSGDSSLDDGYGQFAVVNYDVNFLFGEERSFGIGQRYERGGSNEITCGFTWRLTPKWKFSTYHRYNFRQTSDLDSGLLEQEYAVTRDLHCWDVGLRLNQSKSDGTSFWVVFKLKAFPENEFGFDQSYHKPSSGSN